MTSIDLGEIYEGGSETAVIDYSGSYSSSGSSSSWNRKLSGSSGYTSSFPSSSSGRPYSSGGLNSVYKDPTEGKVKSTTQTTTKTAPDMAMPSFGNVPAIDEARIKRLTQTRSAAGQRALRSALRESLTQASYQDNPNVAAMINRKAMEGFGQGIAETYTRAQKQATEEEARDRGMEMQKQSAVFNAAMQDYMARFGTTSTTDYTYGAGEDAYRMTVSPSGQVTKGPAYRSSSGSAYIDAWKKERGY